MARVVVSTTISKTIGRLRRREAAVYAAVAAGAGIVAEYANERAIPGLYKGRAAAGLVAVSEPTRSGSLISAVRVRTADNEMERIWRWYEYGTRGRPNHYIFGTPLSFEWDQAGALGFRSARYGDRVFFWTVNHPGYEGRHRLPTLEEELRAYAREVWTQLIREAMATG